MTSRSSSVAPLRNLPIFWKLLLPFLVLLLVVGTAGTFMVVRDLTSRSAAALSEQLTLRTVEARSLLHDRELDLLESANYASNLQGMADALGRGDSSAVRRLLESVVALKADLALIAATDASGTSVVELVRSAAGGATLAGSATDWTQFVVVRRALDQAVPAKSVGFIRLGERTLMTMASPVCTGSTPCTPVGLTIVGLDAAEAVRPAAAAAEAAGFHGVTIFDSRQQVLASTSSSAPPAPSRTPRTTEIEQRRMTLAGRRVATAYTGFNLGGQPAGTVAVTIPAPTSVGSVGPAALRLVGLVVAAMVVAALVGAAVSRVILRQLRALVDTSRELGEGQLSARAPVLSEDEHGQLAVSLNRMAEQLEASHETLELQVEQRTHEIRRLLQDRTEFFAGLSHELRTPLAIILTQAEMLLTDSTNAAVVEARDAIRVSASQLLELVNEILELARSESGTIELDLAPVRLGEFVADLRPRIDNLAAAAGISMTVRLPARLPVVTADAARLREIVINLVDNAVKYTPSGGSIEIGATTDGRSVRV